MTLDVLENINLICVRCSIFVIFFAFTLARSADFGQEPIDAAMARNYPLLGAPFLVLSVVQCAVSCVSSPFCAMFLHSAALRKCALFGVTDQAAYTYTFSDINQWQSYLYKSDCQHLYVRALNSCWTITNSQGTMSSALSTCQDLNGDLVQLRSMEEFNFLRATLFSTTSWSTRSYWIGAMKGSSGFTWLGTSLIIDSGMWGEKQPDGFGSKAENCVNAMPIFTFSLNDINCEELSFVVCSIPVALAYGK